VSTHLPDRHPGQDRLDEIRCPVPPCIARRNWHRPRSLYAAQGARTGSRRTATAGSHARGLTALVSESTFTNNDLGLVDHPPETRRSPPVGRARVSIGEARTGELEAQYLGHWRPFSASPCKGRRSARRCSSTRVAHRLPYTAAGCAVLGPPSFDTLSPGSEKARF